MKISAVIDKNVVSGTILLDSIVPLDIKLLHEINYNGVKNYVILDSITVQSSQQYFDYSFLNPTYYTSLIIDVNNIKYTVLEPDIEYTGSSNPTNDRICTQAELPAELPKSNDIAISEIPIIKDFQDFGVRFSHSSISNLINIDDFISNQHMLNDSTHKIRFDVYNADVVLSNKFVLNFAPELTISISGNKPDQVKLFLINARGEERLVTNFWEYSSYNNFNYSSQITSSTKNARLELIYLKDQFNGLKSIKIQDVVVGRVSQYFGEKLANRLIDSVQLTINKDIMYTFESEFFPMFGLRTLLIVGDSVNGQVIQISNGKVLFKRLINDVVYSSIITTSLISQPLKVGVFVNDLSTKIYINDSEVKSVVGDLSLPSGIYTTYIGASNVDQDFDSNAKISFSAYNRNLY